MAKRSDASALIDAYIAKLDDWRAPIIRQVRELARAAKLDEQWSWNCPVWSRDGMVLSVGAFRTHVKINFFKGAALADPHKLFNAGLDARNSRGIDLAEGDPLRARPLKALIAAAAALNQAPKT